MTPPLPSAKLREAYFEPMYRDGADPYGVRDRWYEKRKRALLMASLHRPNFARAFEPACGIGELTLELATRCDWLLACDFSANAVATARSKTAACDNVRIDHLDFTQYWPEDAEALDLIVLSEIGYFLPAEALEQIAEKCRACLNPDGILVACHWLPPFGERTHTSAAIHQQLGVGLHALSSYSDADFLLDVWSSSHGSVAEWEGIR